MAFFFVCLLLPDFARASCDAPVCLVDPDALDLTRIITFEDSRSGWGPGHHVGDLLVLDGATFGERFAGQTVTSEGDFDLVTGTALPPLTLLPGAKGQNLSVVFMNGNNVLNGYGAIGFPKRRAQGEGAIAFLFDAEQSALAFHVRGGENGEVQVTFLRRDGSVIGALDLPAVGEHAYGFHRRNETADIAGVIVTNKDPQGLAFDNLRFGRMPGLG
ncbi:MAG: hypothetical protein AAF636_03625 [Pseudomonadota bacterium]